jgi:hypothetical protein
VDAVAAKTSNHVTTGVFAGGEALDDLVVHHLSVNKAKVATLEWYRFGERQRLLLPWTTEVKTEKSW